MKEIGCPVCSIPMTVRIARGRKSNKPFLMIVCPKDGRHFRGFISDQDYVRGVLSDAEKSMGKTHHTVQGMGGGHPEAGDDRHEAD